MVVTKTMRNIYLVALLLSSVSVDAAVLPEERADILYHSYSGGGINISGPALLVRKSVGDSVSVSAKHYVDTISSASIDVEVILGASTYAEERVEDAFSIEFLNDKTVMSLNYTNSEENDFKAKTVAFGISQDMFGDLTTVSMGYAHGNNLIGKTGSPLFSQQSQTDNFNLSLAQVISKNFIISVAGEVITDVGYLNNPYRRTRYLDTATTYKLEPEIYPNTRTSNAIAIRGRYFLPYRAVIHAESRAFEDSWGVIGNNFEIGYIHPFANDWKFDLHYRTYAQSKANFYSDLFPYSNSQNFIARDKELSTFTNNTIGFGISYDFAKDAGRFIDKASINFKFDHIRFNYKDFRDARLTTYAAGTEPLYRFNANVMQIFLSIWF